MESKKYSKESEISYCFGAFPTYELLKNKYTHASKIVIHEKLDKSEDIRKILELAKKHRVPILTNGKLIEKLSGKGNVYIMGVFNKYEMKVDNNQNQVLLVSPSDMGNLGTIIRSAVAFNIDTIILSDDTVDMYNSKVVRSTQGMLFHINIIRKNLMKILPRLNNNNYTIYTTNVTNGTDIKKCEKQNKFALIVGNEGNGVSKEVADYADYTIYIKTNNNVESLNVAVATSILLYELG